MSTDRAREWREKNGSLYIVGSNQRTWHDSDVAAYAASETARADAAKAELGKLRGDLYELRGVVTAENFAEMQQAKEAAGAALRAMTDNYNTLLDEVLRLKDCNDEQHKQFILVHAEARASEERNRELQAKQEVQIDRAYLNGMALGWNMGQMGDREAYREAQESRSREIRLSQHLPISDETRGSNRVTNEGESE